MFFNFSAQRKTTNENPQNVQSFSLFKPPVAGEPVNDETAWRFSAFFACIRIKSETMAYLPWHVYERGGSKTRYVSGHPVDDLLYFQPNPELSPFYFKELLARSVEAHGNFLAEIERDRTGKPVALWPIEWDRVQVKRENNHGQLYYDVSSPTAERDVHLLPRDVVHVRGPSRDGITGQSIIDLARESISLGLAANAFGGAFLGNGGIPSSIIKNNGAWKGGAGQTKVTLEGVKNMLATWNKNNRGARKMRKTEYLDPGLELQTVGLSPEQVQFIQTYDFTIYDMCRWFCIPPHKLAKLERATWANIESQNVEFVTDAIIPMTSRTESSALVLFGDDRAHYNKMNVLGLLRGDSAARKEYYKDLFNMGVMSIDEIRDKEDMDALESGRGGLRVVPSNMTTIERMVEGDTTPQRRNTDPGNANALAGLLRQICDRVCSIELGRTKKYNVETSTDEIAKQYVSFAQICVDNFRHIAQLMAEHFGKTEDSEEAIKAFFSDWAANSADELQNAIMRGEQQTLRASWEHHKAERLAERLTIRLREL